MKSGFTLVETMITVIIILILATLGMAGYRQAVDNARQRVCATNLMCLEKAVENHFLTTGIAPATLGEIQPEHFWNAYVEVMQNIDFLSKFSYFFVKLNTPRKAYAEIRRLKDLVSYEKMRAYGLPLQVFQCPADQTPPPEGISYGINANLRRYNRWKDVPSDLAILGDCESYTFSSPAGVASRHIKNFGTKKTAQLITKGKKIKRKDKGDIHFGPPVSLPHTPHHSP